MLEHYDTRPPPADRVRPRLVEGSAGQPLGSRRYSPLGRASKRLLDIVASVALLVVGAPLFGAIWLAIRTSSPGPAIFRQTRVGYREENFTMLKFRTMTIDNDDTAHREFVTAMLRDGQPRPTVAQEAAAGNTMTGERHQTYKIVNDPRITTVGGFLRRTSLDELPQLINVLRGEMTLVGPRPCLEYEAREFSDEHRQRAESVPGITGLWQVTGRNHLHMRDALDLDVRYVERCSLWLDLTILVKTVLVVLRGSGF